MRLRLTHTQWKAAGLALLAAGASAALNVCAFPNIDAWWAGLAFLVPMVLWAYEKPNRKLFLWAGFAGFWVSWAVLLSWLRHVYPFWGWFGVAFLSFYIAAFYTAWLAGLWWTMLRCDLKKPAAVRVMAMLGLAAWWVVLEWGRTWFLSGFPWLPLSASQWTQPVMLQVAEWTGAWGVSFILVFLNLCVAGYLRSLYGLLRPGHGGLTEKRVKVGGVSLRVSFHMELYVGVLVMLGCVSLMTLSLGRMQHMREPLFKAGVVQPWAEPLVKWDPNKAQENWEVLRALTLSLRAQGPDLYLWPEASTPFAVFGQNSEMMRSLIEDLVNTLEKPLLMGNLAHEDERWYNGVFAVQPQSGVAAMFYAKQHLVPFGEYVPRWLPFVEKISPVEGSFYPGEFALPLGIKVANKTLRAGPLVCYEDIFPSIARALARNGADFFYVATNNAWYGTEAGAYQHAAHAALRAVETRRLVVRCGNDGWSGWVDEFGYAAALEESPDGKVSAVPAGEKGKGTIYFRGVGTLKVSRSPYYAANQTFYVRHGEWFVWACMGLAVLAALRLRFGQKVG